MKTAQQILREHLNDDRNDYLKENPTFKSTILDAMHKYARERVKNNSVSADVVSITLYGIFQHGADTYIGYWTNREAAQKVCNEEYCDQWYVDELVKQD